MKPPHDDISLSEILSAFQAASGLGQALDFVPWGLRWSLLPSLFKLQALYNGYIFSIFSLLILLLTIIMFLRFI